MSRSEFRYNKRRKHYAYLFKDVGSRRKNIVLTSKPVRYFHNKARNNVKLYKHPNPNSSKQAYLIPIVYNDESSSFEEKKLNWRFDPNDKRKVKRIKKKHKIKK